MSNRQAILFPEGAGRILAPSGVPAIEEAARNNWYEASRWSPNRSFIWFPVQEANRDLDRFTRLELSRKARYLYKNSPFIRGMIERIVTIVVGNGFTPVFRSSSPDWNKRARRVMARLFKNIHLGPRASFRSYQRAVLRAKLVDGECFSIKTEDSTVNYRRAIQGIESDRVGGGKSEVKSDNNPQNFSGAVDGFNLNPQGIVESYNVSGVKTPYPADTIIHHADPARLNQYRSETILSAAINTAHDMDDILALEKQAVKNAASKKDIIKTGSGQLDPETFRSLRYGPQTQAGTYPTLFNLPEDKNNKDDYYRVVFGSDSVVLKRGDEYVQTNHIRPGAAWQGFMDFMSQTVCLSSGFPASTILPISIGGTDIRRDLDIAQRVADPMQSELASEIEDIVLYLLEGEIIDGELRKGCPEDWDSIVWHFPPKINVDRNQAREDREDVAAGLMSIEEFHARYSNDSDQVEDAVVSGAKKRLDKIKSAGFKDVKEFVQVLSLNANLFSGNNADPKKPEPKKENQ